MENECVKMIIMKNKKIQVLRGLAIIAVIATHTCPYDTVQVYVRPFLNFAVALFLFLSGYLTDASKIRKKGFYRKRIAKVLIPYLIWSIIYTLVDEFLSGKDISIKEIFGNVCSAKGAASLYYVFVYIQFVILTPLLIKMAKMKRWYVGLIVSPLFLMLKIPVSFILSLPKDSSIMNWVWITCCLSWFNFYYIGIYLCNSKNSKAIKTCKLLALLIISVILEILEGVVLYKKGSTDPGTQLKITSLCTSSIVILIAYNFLGSVKTYSNKIMVLLGDYSSGLFFSHILILWLMKKYLVVWNNIPFILNTVIIIVLALVLDVVLKKILGSKKSSYLGI